MTDTAFVIRRSRPRAPPDRGRFEYRVWPRVPHPAVSLLLRDWPQTGAERRSDIYLLHPAGDRTLVKLRGGRRLEIKRRDADVGTVQHWTMAGSAEFPLAPAVRGELAAALSLPADLPQAAGRSPAHLLAALAGAGARVVPQTVDKSRLLFREADCRAEICRVSFAGWRGVTIALEAKGLPSIAAALDDLHLGALPNRSYGEALLRHGILQTPRRRLPGTPTPTERRPA